MPFFLFVKNDLSFLPDAKPLFIAQAKDPIAATAMAEAAGLVMLSNDRRGYSFFSSVNQDGQWVSGRPETLEELWENAKQWNFEIPLEKLCQKTHRNLHLDCSPKDLLKYVPCSVIPGSMSVTMFCSLVSGDLVQLGTEEMGVTNPKYQYRWMKVFIKENKRVFLIWLNTGVGDLIPSGYELEYLFPHFIRNGKLHT